MELTREQLEAIGKCATTRCRDCILRGCCSVEDTAQTALAYLDRAERAEAKLRAYERQVEHEQSC